MFITQLLNPVKVSCDSSIFATGRPYITSLLDQERLPRYAQPRIIARLAMADDRDVKDNHHDGHDEGVDDEVRDNL